MKIGYPCINRSLLCTGNKTFRLKSYSEHRFVDTVRNNLDCLQQMLKYNVQHHLLYFRITSDLIPFASHPICTYPWQQEFKSTFEEIGAYIKKHQIRITMHPDQFILLNAKDPDIVQRSIDELTYHAHVLDLLQLDTTAKIQLHIGGVYGDKQASINRFIQTFTSLPSTITQRLAIENDHQRYHVHDCFFVSDQTSIPIIFDYFHHQLYHHADDFINILQKFTQTWKNIDGIPLCDYSSQEPTRQKGSHAHTINLADFRHFLERIQPYDIDIMLEIKDKEQSALKAITLITTDPRFQEAT